MPGVESDNPMRYISGRGTSTLLHILSSMCMHPVEWGVHVGRENLGREWMREHKGVVREKSIAGGCTSAQQEIR